MEEVSVCPIVKVGDTALQENLSGSVLTVPEMAKILLQGNFLYSNKE